MMSLADIDNAFGTAMVDNIYCDLKKRVECSVDQKNSDLLWRLARCCHELSNNASEESRRKELLFEGQKHAESAVNLDSTSFEAVRWAAVMTGSATDFMGTKEKIEAGAKFKHFLDTALTMDGNEYSLLHMRGRYSFSVAGLSWIERKAAAVFYSTPPKATYEDALKDFLAAFELESDWLENLVYIARCYFAMKDNASARKYLLMAVDMEAPTGADKDLMADAKKMISKC